MSASVVVVVLVSLTVPLPDMVSSPSESSVHVTAEFEGKLPDAVVVAAEAMGICRCRFCMKEAGAMGNVKTMRAAAKKT